MLMFRQAEHEGLLRKEYIKGLLTGVAVTSVFNILLALLIFNPVQAQEVTSTRASQFEWQCEEADGTLISGHTRQDKAFQSCMNAALADNDKTYFVRGGTFRVEASGSGLSPPDEPDPVDPPPVDPPIEPPPPDPPPPDDSIVEFGPVTAVLEYPASISALALDRARWELTFTLNNTAGQFGLASRDESGQTDPGHLTIWVNNGVITVRHQDATGGLPSVTLTSSTTVVAGTEYVATVSIDVDNGIGLFVNGVLEDSDPVAFGLSGNSLPLTLGGSCIQCDGVIPPDREIDGTVYLEIIDSPLDLPTPVVGSTMLTWTNATMYDNGEPLPPEEIERISIYGTNPRALVANVDGDTTAYEVINLPAGTHCFVATTWAKSLQSDDSNEACKVIE